MYYDKSVTEKQKKLNLESLPVDRYSYVHVKEETKCEWDHRITYRDSTNKLDENYM